MNSLLTKIQNHESNIGIVGLGYVGLPLAIRFSEERFPVVGFDTIEILKKISASALVVQAGGTLITDWREVLKVSRLAGIKIYGFPDRPIK